jgi:hypothetical protein
MGVEAFFYGYDEDWFAVHQPVSVDLERLLNAGILERDGAVAPGYSAVIRSIDSVMGGNKQWHNNLAAAMVYHRIRPYLPTALRAQADDILQLLFWDVDDDLCARTADIPPPRYDPATTCWLYAAATVSYIAGSPIDLEALRPGFAPALAGWPAEERAALGLRNLDDADTFIWWAGEWLALFGAVAALGGDEPWALLIYLSY